MRPAARRPRPGTAGGRARRDEGQRDHPLAHGGQPWQDATIFDAVVLSQGPEFYKAAMIDLDPAALSGPQMVEVFDRMAKLRSYVDDTSRAATGTSPRRW